ncbi:MAG: hypothetical protein AB1306_08270 [Nitrospirota bacterium]
MSNNSSDNFARITAIVSLILAIIAISVPFFQQKSALQTQKEQFEELQKEDLSVQLDPYVTGELRLTDIQLGPLGHVVQIPWKLTVSNIGNRQLSITEHLITRGDSPTSMQYTGIDGGFLDRKSRPVEFPVKLEPGESETYYVFVGITVSQEIYDILASLNASKQLTDRNATKELGRKGIDIYGNSVEYKEYENGKFTYFATDKGKAQRFWLQLTTGRDNIFYATAMKYEPVNR